MLSADTDTIAAEGSTGHIYQDISIQGGASYNLTMFSKTSNGFSSQQARYAIYDNDNSEWIVPRIGTSAFSAASWGYVSEIFTTPLSCTSVRLYLYQNINSTTVEFGDSVVWLDVVSIKKRLVLTSAPVPEWKESGNIGSYRHTSTVNMGYDNMQVTSFGDLGYMSDWMENGLARSVIVKGWSGETVWEGFVNEVSAQLGGLVLTVGPLMDVVNRGRIVYKTINWGVTPAIGGATVRTQWKDDLTSQGKFSVLEGLVTGGEGDAEEMDQLINTILRDTSWPEVTQNVSLGSSTNLSLTISCLGYGHLLDKYFYYQVQDAGDYTVTEKIRDILAGDPNSIFATAALDLEDNDTAVHKYEDTDRSALATLKEIANLGNSEFDRYVFGVFGGQSFKFWNATDRGVRYYQSIKDGRITDPTGAIVQPWEVVPGEWLFMSDLVPGKPSMVRSYRQDQRFVFIESATYAAPYQLTLSGGRASKFKQRVERLGLGGI
jgi:hypothetical protein